MFTQIRYFFSENSLRDLTNIISKAQVDVQNLSSNIHTLLQTVEKYNMRGSTLKEQENLDSIKKFIQTSEGYNSYVSETCVVLNSEKNENISLALSNTTETSSSVQVCVHFRTFIYTFLFIYYLLYFSEIFESTLLLYFLF